LFDASLAENIALATAIDEIDFSRLEEAVRLSQLDELVRTLPNAYAEIIGERGVRLSGGQRQRVGIARALYRRTSVLILDEATNALDGMTENEIMSTLETLRGAQTVILIAHRLRTVRACDLIFEIDNGSVIGSGTFEELTRLSSGFRLLLHGTEHAAHVP
jgi:ABC-type bacteriocin/lantibiotic exporter with double-glycine peptidase domain